MNIKQTNILGITFTIKNKDIPFYKRYETIDFKPNLNNNYIYYLQYD